MPQNGVEIILVDPGEETPVLTFAPIVKQCRNGKTPDTELASRADEKCAIVLKRNERGCERWHPNKTEHVQMPTAAEALQQCFRSANADQDSFFFECIVNSRYCRSRDTKVTSYLSYGIKNLWLFLLVCDGDAAQNLQQFRTLVLLCLEGQPGRKRWKTSRNFLSGHHKWFVFPDIGGRFPKTPAQGQPKIFLRRKISASSADRCQKFWQRQGASRIHRFTQIFSRIVSEPMDYIDLRKNAPGRFTLPALFSPGG